MKIAFCIFNAKRKLYITLGRADGFSQNNLKNLNKSGNIIFNAKTKL